MALGGRLRLSGVVELDGGHSINIENADGFDRAVLDFVADRADG